MSNGRFDYIEWDHESEKICAKLKEKMEDLESSVEFYLRGTRERALAITKLEECFMWIGKAIRADQLDGRGPRPAGG